jgi:S-adenosylmethionine hydrolase
VTVKVGSTLHAVPWVAAYGEVAPGETLVHVDSVGLLTIAVREGRADEQLNLAEGMAVSLAGRRSSTAE